MTPVTPLIYLNPPKAPLMSVFLEGINIGPALRQPRLKSADIVNDLDKMSLQLFLYRVSLNERAYIRPTFHETTITVEPPQSAYTLCLQGRDSLQELADSLEYDSSSQDVGTEMGATGLAKVIKACGGTLAYSKSKNGTRQDERV
jgi:hypothetical protein